MRLIDADAKVHISIYNGQYEEYTDEEMSIADILDSYSDEGCPDEVERKKGKWMTKSTFMPDHYGGYYIDQYVCTNCESEFFKPSKFCPNCGSDQRGDGNGNVQ